MKIFKLLISFAALGAIGTQVNAAGPCCGAVNASAESAVIQPVKVERAVFQAASSKPAAACAANVKVETAALPVAAGCGGCGGDKKDDGKTKAASIIPASAGCGGCGGGKKDDGKTKAAMMAPAGCPASAVMQAAVMTPAAACEDKCSDKKCDDKKSCATGLQSAEVAPEADASSEVAAS